MVCSRYEGDIMRPVFLACALGLKFFLPTVMAAPSAGEVPLPNITVEPKTPTREAVSLVQSAEEAKQKKARSLLTDEKFLQQLNTEREYLVFPPESLQL